MHLVSTVRITQARSELLLFLFMSMSICMSGTISVAEETGEVLALIGLYLSTSFLWRLRHEFLQTHQKVRRLPNNCCEILQVS